MSKEMVRHFYENVYGKAPLKPEGELRERIAKLEVQAHNRNEHISDLEAKVEALREAFSKIESSSIGSVEHFRETGRITVGYKEFCRMAALEGLSDD